MSYSYGEGQDFYRILKWWNSLTFDYVFIFLLSESTSTSVNNSDKENNRPLRRGRRRHTTALSRDAPVMSIASNSSPLNVAKRVLNMKRKDLSTSITEESEF